MRASRSWIFLLVGVLLAGVTGVALYQFATSSRQPTTATGATVNIVVAKVTLPPRTMLSADQLDVKAYPSDLVPPGSFTTTSDVVGRTTAVQIARAQPIVRDLLSTIGSPEGTSEEIPDGMVMVTFPTNDALTTAGLVSAGDRVDLLATVLHGTGENAKLTQTTIQNLEVVEVLAPTKDQPQRQRALVFVVDHQVALVLKYLRDAQTTIDLAVRSRTETQSTKTSLVDLQYLLETYGMQR
jgi:pilus assembly protein CpaB